MAIEVVFLSFERIFQRANTSGIVALATIRSGELDSSKVKVDGYQSAGERRGGPRCEHDATCHEFGVDLDGRNRHMSGRRLYLEKLRLGQYALLRTRV